MARRRFDGDVQGAAAAPRLFGGKPTVWGLFHMMRGRHVGGEAFDPFTKLR